MRPPRGPASGVEFGRQARRRPIAGAEIGLPKEAGGDRTPRPPGLAEPAQLRLGRAPGEPEAFAGGDLQAEIGGGPDIGAPESEDQIDLGAPPADALERAEGGLRRLVVGRGKAGKI